MEKKIQTTGRYLIEPKRISGGFLLADPDDSFPQDHIAVTVFVLVFVSFFTFLMFALVLRLLLNTPSADNMETLRLFLLLLAVGVFFLLAFVVDSVNSSILLKPGEIVLSTYPLHMGETCRVRYRRPLRWGSVPWPGKITAKWLCYEWVQYEQSITFAETATHLLWEADFPSRPVPPKTTQFESSMEVEVRAEGPPSLDAEDNKVRWELQVTVDLPWVAKGTSCFQLKVLPESYK